MIGILIGIVTERKHRDVGCGIAHSQSALASTVVSDVERDVCEVRVGAGSGAEGSEPLSVEDRACCNDLCTQLIALITVHVTTTREACSSKSVFDSFVKEGSHKFVLKLRSHV